LLVVEFNEKQKKNKIVLYLNDTGVKTSEKGIHCRAVGGKNTNSNSEKKNGKKKKI
jgi:hypothetical protein